MRLINARTLRLDEFYDNTIPRYAILSHAWGDGEVSFQEWQDPTKASKKSGYAKIKGACRQALKDGLEYLWVDTNCIDKTSSAELTEAINSMFAWYRDAVFCYAYLSDVPTLNKADADLLNSFRKSRWFTRGWTLQELLAPRHVTFYSSDWGRIGTKSGSLAKEISTITGIDVSYLTNQLPLASASIAKKMHWLSRRTTTRLEDMAYCMLGVFDINMPLLYGEGSKAFIRLQEEIIKISNDHTIFCWTWTSSVPPDWVSLLAPSPETFKFSGDFVKSSVGRSVSTYSMTNSGLSIRLPIIQSWSYFFVVVNVHCPGQPSETKACIPISGLLDNNSSENNKLMERVPFPQGVSFLYSDWAIMEPQIFVLSRADPLRKRRTSEDISTKYGLLFILGNTKRLLDKRISSVSQYDSGDGVFLIEKTKGLIGIETFPAGLFDLEHSIFVFNQRITGTIYGGLMRLGNLQASGCVIFFAINMLPNKPLKWFCRILPPTSWGTNNNQRKALLKELATSEALRSEDQREDCSSELDICLKIGHKIEHTSMEIIRPVYFCFGVGDFKWRLNAMHYDTVDEEYSGSDADSNVPAIAHRPEKRYK